MANGLRYERNTSRLVHCLALGYGVNRNSARNIMNASQIKNLWRDVDPFTKAYTECALWSGQIEDGQPIDENYNWTHLATETLEKMVADCKRFQSENSRDLTVSISIKNNTFVCVGLISIKELPLSGAGAIMINEAGVTGAHLEIYTAAKLNGCR